MGAVFNQWAFANIIFVITSCFPCITPSSFRSRWCLLRCWHWACQHRTCTSIIWLCWVLYLSKGFHIPIRISALTDFIIGIPVVWMQSFISTVQHGCIKCQSGSCQADPLVCLHLQWSDLTLSVTLIYLLQPACSCWQSCSTSRPAHWVDHMSLVRLTGYSIVPPWTLFG